MTLEIPAESALGSRTGEAWMIHKLELATPDPIERAYVVVPQAYAHTWIGYMGVKIASMGTSGRYPPDVSIGLMIES